MRIIYLNRASEDANSGINKKISSQLKHLLNQDVGATIYSICANIDQPIQNQYTQSRYIKSNDRSISIIKKIKREHSLNKVFREIIASLKTEDILYMRIPYPSLHMSKILKKPRACKIVIEYQTIEPLEYRLKRKYWYLLTDFLFGSDIRRYTNAIIGVTNQITQYELTRSGNPHKPHITIGNGIDVNTVPVRQGPQYNGEELHLLCVANVSPWHGLDRILKGITDYAGTLKVVLHVAGDGDVLPYLMKMTINLRISDHVVFHGFKSGSDLDDLFNQCHIAVGSLGIHRIGLKEASILKAREYCARGIPFIYGTSDPDFPEGFPYILRLPADESPVDITKVAIFAEEIYGDSNHPQKMRRFAEEHLDWSIKMKCLKEFLESLN